MRTPSHDTTNLVRVLHIFLAVVFATFCRVPSSSQFHSGNISLDSYVRGYIDLRSCLAAIIYAQGISLDGYGQSKATFSTQGRGLIVLTEWALAIPPSQIAIDCSKKFSFHHRTNSVLYLEVIFLIPCCLRATATAFMVVVIHMMAWCD